MKSLDRKTENDRKKQKKTDKKTNTMKETDKQKERELAERERRRRGVEQETIDKATTKKCTVHLNQSTTHMTMWRIAFVISTKQYSSE